MLSLFTHLKNWTYSSQTFASEKNKEIRLERSFGVWSVYVDGYHQTSPFTEKLWRKALSTIPKETLIRNILILGFGAGGNLHAIYKRFPNCSVVSIEHDPTMVEIANKINPLVRYQRHTVLIADAKDVIVSLSKTFDLILFDLYTSDQPSTLIYDKEFIQNLQRNLNKDGHLLINMFKHKTDFGYFNDYFAHIEDWTLINNAFAHYKHLATNNVQILI